MKKTRNNEFLQGLEELSVEETSGIVGGESLWYWVGYAIGYAGYIISHSSGTQTAGQQAMNMALS